MRSCSSLLAPLALSVLSACSDARRHPDTEMMLDEQVDGGSMPDDWMAQGGGASGSGGAGSGGSGGSAGGLDGSGLPVTPQPTILPRCFIQAADSDPAFVSDLVLDCSDNTDAAQGIRVAIEGTEAVLAATVGGQPVLLRASENGGELELLPAALANKTMHLATQPSGGLLVLADTTDDADLMVEGAGQLVFLAREGDGWRSEEVFDGLSWLAPHGFEVAADGTPHVWFSVVPPTLYKLGQRVSDGTWAIRNVARSSTQSAAHWTLDRAGKTVAFWIETEDDARQLVVEVDGTRLMLGPTSTITDRYQPLLLAMSAEASGTPAVAALVHTETGITAAWADGAGGSVERELVGTAFQPSTCAVEQTGGGCITSCLDAYDSVEPGESAFVQTSDGMTWVVWLQTHVHRVFTREQRCTPTFGAMGEPTLPTCACVAASNRDDSTTTLRVARLDLARADAAEVLSMELPGLRYGLSTSRQEQRFFDARASGDRIAIGMRLAEPGEGDELPHVNRLMLLDTSKL